MLQQPTPCRIVPYQLSQDDVGEIFRERAANPHQRGNTPTVGDVVPMTMVRIFPDEYGPGIPGVNGQLLLDGNHAHWVTSRREGTDPGTWSWPTRG